MAAAVGERGELGFGRWEAPWGWLYRGKQSGEVAWEVGDGALAVDGRERG